MFGQYRGARAALPFSTALFRQWERPPCSRSMTRMVQRAVLDTPNIQPPNSNPRVKINLFFSSPAFPPTPLQSAGSEKCKRGSESHFLRVFLSGSCIIIIIYCPQGDCTGVTENLALPFKLFVISFAEDDLAGINTRLLSWRGTRSELLSEICLGVEGWGCH